jgi:uncharacterized BrkB/YihY/UPF0761 family membrane protein
MGSTAAMSKPRPSRFVRFLMISFRILFLTLLLTGLGMGLGLFTGIMVTVVGSLFAHHPVDLTRSYKVFAFPAALIFGGCTLVFQIIQSVREATRH